MATYQRVVTFGRSVVREVRAANVPFMAGSLAYDAFVSLVPLLVLAFLLVALVDDPTLARRLLSLVGAVLPARVTALLDAAVTGRTEHVGASVIGVVTLLWGALRLFRGLDTAFSEIHGTRGQDSLLDQLRDGFVVLSALGGALAAAVAATVVFTLPSVRLGAAGPPLLVVGLTVAFLPMYWRFPGRTVSVRETVPGAFVAALGWTLLQVLFELYVVVASTTTTAGALGAVLLLLVWLYLGAFCLLVGAAVNAVVAGHARTLPAAERAGVDTGLQLATPATPGTEERTGRTTASSGPADEGELRRENRRLRTALAWYRRPVWRRLHDRLRGESPPDVAPSDPDVDGPG